jgi:D-3-phosphoglycerate dehydrogenase / 2-oxoglutarate reductase
VTTRVLVSAPYMQPVLERFAAEFDDHGIELVVPAVTERLEEDDLLAVIGDIDGAICGDDRFTERVLKAAPRLKVVSKWGTGIDSIDAEAAARLGIAVCRTPDAFSIPVADTVLGYMLCFARKLPWMDREMKAGRWEKIPGRSLSECVLGVIGVGDAGKAVVRHAVGVGMTVLGNDLVEMPPSFLAETGVQMVGKLELLGRSDFVSLNCDLNPTSQHLMNGERFAQMRSDAVLINAARGPIVHEPSLVSALQQGRIAGAAMDVFEDEPLPLDSPLLAMDNVMLAPHNANSSPAAWDRVHRSTMDNLLDHLGDR